MSFYLNSRYQVTWCIKFLLHILPSSWFSLGWFILWFIIFQLFFFLLKLLLESCLIRICLFSLLFSVFFLHFLDNLLNFILQTYWISLTILALFFISRPFSLTFKIEWPLKSHLSYKNEGTYLVASDYVWEIHLLVPEGLFVSIVQSVYLKNIAWMSGIVFCLHTINGLADYTILHYMLFSFRNLKALLHHLTLNVTVKTFS